MKITQTQKSKKFTISNITDSEMIKLYLHSDNVKFRQAIAKALIESTDEEAIQTEYGYGVTEYFQNVGVSING